MKKAIVGLVGVGAIVGIGRARHTLNHKMREHCEQMAAHCKNVATHRSEPIGRT